MYRIDESAWPVVVFEFAGVQSLADHEGSLQRWNALFAREADFVALRVFHDEDALVHPEGVGRVTKQWLRDGAADAIRRHVAAMMNVVLPPAAYERMKHMSVEAAFGVPGGVFDSVEAAAAWFQSRFGKPLSLPQDHAASA